MRDKLAYTAVGVLLGNYMLGPVKKLPWMLLSILTFILGAYIEYKYRIM